MGVAVATGVSLSVRTFLDPALVPHDGWRIAFVPGGLGGVLSCLLRRSMEEWVDRYGGNVLRPVQTRRA